MPLKLAVAAVLLVSLTFLVLALGRRHAWTLQHARRLRIERFKLKRRHADIRLEVFGSPEVVQAIKRHAKEHHVSVEAAERKARLYLAEILPKFNLLAYYRFGAPIARLFLYFLYRVSVERKALLQFNESAPKGTRVVYVINHRSNVDYLLVAHMLFKFISLSYAVGEWARVWPLNHLFKWFGAYFIRRRYREPLYHAVLRRFVQTITIHGVTQGIFLEGELSRDGAFRKPKLGMLDYIVSSKADPSFTEPLFIVPTAINLDRTLEDRILTDELLGREQRSTTIEKLRTSFGFLFKNFFRGLFRRFKRYGHAVVSFGQPFEVDAFVRQHPGIFSEEWEDRKPHLKALAEEIMHRISDAMPMTPVPIAASLFRAAGTRPLGDDEILSEIEALQRKWRDRVWYIRDRAPSDVWRSAREILVMRKLIREEEGRWIWDPEELLLRDYYANSLVPFGSAEGR